jgi:hypothetical protein
VLCSRNVGFCAAAEEQASPKLYKENVRRLMARELGASLSDYSTREEAALLRGCVSDRTDRQTDMMLSDGQTVWQAGRDGEADKRMAGSDARSTDRQTDRRPVDERCEEVPVHPCHQHWKEWRRPQEENIAAALRREWQRLCHAAQSFHGAAVSMGRNGAIECFLMCLLSFRRVVVPMGRRGYRLDWTVNIVIYFGVLRGPDCKYCDMFCHSTLSWSPWAAGGIAWIGLQIA